MIPIEMGDVMNNVLKAGAAIGISAAAYGLSGNIAEQIFENSAENNRRVTLCAEILGNVAALSEVIPTECASYAGSFRVNDDSYMLPSATAFHESKWRNQELLGSDTAEAKPMLIGGSIAAGAIFYTLATVASRRKHDYSDVSVTAILS